MPVNPTTAATDRVKAAGTAAAHPTAETISLLQLLSFTVALASIALLVRHFQLEGAAFFQLVVISASGFVINYLLPLRYRLPFFVVLSMGTIGYVLGIGPGGSLILVGLVLIGLCSLPIPFWLRVAAVAASGAGLAVMRSGLTAVPLPTAIWPILGSMFMFRIVAYLYDVRHQPALRSFWPSLSYFFLLPNVCFPLFPVVDYTTFCQCYYNDDRQRIHLVGIQWMFRGVVQLVLYQVVYQTLVLDPVSVVNVVDLGRYLLWPFLLYFRVSGQFHVIVGILHLFGFNLPETHHSYFLASSFTDFWRRINIYWKDFMMKVFYYPAYFALRRRGETLALVLSTILVFVVTWSLHAYQWFWIRGSSLFVWNDVLFWAILGLLVVINSLYEWRKGRRRMLKARALTWRQTLFLALKTVAMFLVICVLWSLWSTESVSIWWSLWSAALHPPSSGQAAILLMILAVPATIVLWVIATSRGWIPDPKLPSAVRGLMIAGTAALLIAVSTSAVYKRLGFAGQVIAAVRWGGLNQADVANMERGYYENLMGVDRFNGDLWALYQNRPLDWNQSITDAGLARPIGTSLPWELVPSLDTRFKGASFKTNQWGMHDKEYARARPAECYRFALLGASHAMGTGVDESQTFEALLEDRLNRESAGSPYRCYEILNFAVYGYNAIHQIEILEKRVLAFEPNAILYVGHPEDSQRVSRSLVQRVLKGTARYRELSDLTRSAGVDAQTPERIANQELAPLGNQILSWVYQRLVATDNSHRVCSGFVFLPMVLEMNYAVDVGKEIQAARDSGFTVLDLSGVYRGAERNSLWIAEWDAHPNAAAHRLIADRLFELIREGSMPLLSCDRPTSPTTEQSN